jgi:hypothetical protein
LVGGALGGSGATVTLHRPPPLERWLDLRSADGCAELLDGGERIAFAAVEWFDLDIPAPPPLDEAREAQARYVGHRRHRFPSCFVCGPEREPGDGLAIYPGDVGRQVAATWTPASDLAASARCTASSCVRGSIAPAISRSRKRPASLCSGAWR